jgi:hypothetical protein
MPRQSHSSSLEDETGGAQLHLWEPANEFVENYEMKLHVMKLLTRRLVSLSCLMRALVFVTAVGDSFE